MRKVKKIVLIILSVLIMLIVIGCLFVYKGSLNGIIVREVVLQANKVLNATVSIGELTGNPFSQLTVHDIRIVQGDKEILKVNKVDLDYSLLRLLNSEIVINSIKIDDLKAEIWQQPDSLWSIQKIYVPAVDTVSVIQPKKSSGYVIKINEVELSRFMANIHPLDTVSFIPKTVEANLLLSFLMKGDIMEVNLKTMAIKTANPEVDVKSLSLNYTSDSASYKWDHFKLQLPRTVIVSGGKYYPRQPNLTDATLAIDTLAFDDIRKLFPQFNLYGNPSVSLSAKGGLSKVDFTVLVKEKLQTGEIKGWVKGMDTIPEYDVNLNVSNLDGSSWTGNPEYTSKITGIIKAKGKSADLLKGELVASGNFTEVTWLDKTLRNLIFDATKDTMLIKGNLATDAWFGGLTADFSIEDYLKDFRYKVLGSGRHIDLAKLYMPKNLYSALNLKIKAEGVGMNPMTGSIKATVASLNSTITKRPIDEFHTTFSYRNGNYNVSDFLLNSPFFQLQATGKGNLKHENDVAFDFGTKDFHELLNLIGYGQYALDGTIKGDLKGSADRYKISSAVNLSRLATDSVVVKDLIGDIAVVKDTTFHANISLTTGEVSKDSIIIQKFGTNLAIALGNELSVNFKLNADSLSVNHELLGAVNGQATLATSDSIRFDFQIKLDSLNYLPYKVGPSSFNMKSRLPVGDKEHGLTASLHQMIDHFKPEPFKKYLAAVQRDSISLNGRMDANNFSYDTLTVKKIGIDLLAIAQKNNYRGTLAATADSINYMGRVIQKGELHTAYSDKNFHNELIFTLSDTVSGELNVDIALRKEIEIGLQHLLLRSPAETWKGGGDSTKIVYANNTLDIKNLTITGGTDKFIKADGLFAFKGKEDLDVSLMNLDLNNINKLVGGKTPVTGTMDGTLKMTGTSDAPVINASVKMNNLTANKRKIDQLQTNLVYRADSISLDASMTVKDTLIFEAAVKGRYHLSLEDSIHLPSTSDKFSGKLKMNRFDLSLLNPFIPDDQIEVQGFVNSDITTEGPENNMKINGFLDWKDGSFRMPEYGMNYDHVKMRTGIKNDSLFITEFVAQAGAGSLNVSGYSKVNQQNIYEPQSMSLKIYGKEFKVVDSERMQATVNTNITLKSENNQPIFAGDVEVIRSEANADAFIAEYNQANDESEPPLLVKALTGDTTMSKIKVPVDTTQVNIKPNLQFYNKLRGSLTVTVPSNMWIRGKDMNFEVKGILKATKDGANMLMYGDLEVKRGFYKIYGKRFDFKSGKITLTGEEDINPMLDFVVAYSFRNIDNALSSLELTITGRLKDPKVSFTLDDVKIEEQDALSVLVFGSTSQQLTDGQKSAINTSTTDIAKNIALGQMSTILKDAMQSALKLDVIEIAGADNWNQGSVTIGKYIGKNLFVSYQYTFALDKTTKIIEPQKISIEYQLFKFLSLMATNQDPNSGFDIIFKKEFK